jgi:preprotein translocase subunit SecF
MSKFVEKRYWYFLISAIVIIPGIISLAVFGLKLGIDFKSGTTMTLNFSPNVQENQLRQSLGDLGYKDASIQHTAEGNYFIRVREISTEERDKLIGGLETGLGSQVTVRDFALVSAAVAAATVRAAIIAVIVAAVGILLYISWAFRHVPRPFRWGTCAIIALLHDILVVMGVFSILGWLAGVEVDALFITGMLTVAGYSVHDTIVVFDRIRENMTKGISNDFEVVVNHSIIQTFTRSLSTSLTVLFVLAALFVLGGATIHYFILVLLIGVITGTYSSICNASPLLLVWDKGEWSRFYSWLQPARKSA